MAKQERKAAQFVHLRVKSAYSLLESAVRPDELARLSRANSMPAVAVTDSDNLFGVYEIGEELAKAGVQPIVGCLLSVEFAEAAVGQYAGVRPKPPRLPLLVQNEAGYRNLVKLLSAAYLDAQPGDWPHVKPENLAAHAEGLILLSGGPGGPLNALIVAGQPDAAEELLLKLSAIFGDRLYIELQRHNLPEERAAEDTLIELAYTYAIPLVATNDVHFGEANMYEAHDALLCIADGAFVSQQDRRRLTREHRFKTAAEMAAQFADLPEALENTIEIAKRCAYRTKKRNPILPQFVPDSGLTPVEELRAQAEEGLTRRLAKHGKYADEKIYRDRLEFELGVIIRMDFAGYFLIVSDFMKWTRGENIPVGVRGSGATSLVAWSLDITNLDPIRFGLLFERFLNPERISMPDFDIDFCQERRDEVVRYVQQKYGADRVAHIIALGSLQARAAVRDVGRVLQMPLGLVDRIAKMVPNPPGQHISITDAIENEPRLQQISEQEPSAAQLFSIVGKIEGLYRHASTHPAGVVIGDRPLDEIVPLYRDPRSHMPVTQFDYEDAEKAGLVKFDFLGLKTLTVIAKAEELLKRRGIALDTQGIGFEDVPTFEMLSRGESVGVFQLEGAGMRDLLRKMRPDHINDLVALVALYRPGPMDSIPKYIACKRGREEPDYLHPALEPILNETFGVMTYQEDVMRIAREFGGYTMGQADLLRRAMGKKIPSEMAKHRETFIKGAGERGILSGVAEQIFEQAAKFAGYGFNKGHAAAYAQVAYQTAFLKANYPVEFLAASMTLDIGNTDRLNVFRQEAQRLSVRVAPPDINRSEAFFACDAASNVIYYALAAVKGVGRQAMEHLVAEREANGSFRNIADFARRVDPRLMNKRAFENLVRSGAFDALHNNRHQLAESADIVLGDASRSARERESGQTTLFGEASNEGDALRLAPIAEWAPHEKLSEEFSAIGFYLSGHPLDGFEASLRRLGAVTFASLCEDRRRSGFRAVIAGTIIRKQERRGRNEQPYGFISLSDPTGMFEVMVFSEVLTAARPLLEPGRSVLMAVAVDWMDEELKLRALSVDDLEKASVQAGEGLRIHIENTEPLNAIAGQLKPPGKGIVTIVVPGVRGQQIEIALPKRISVSRDLRAAIKSLPGVAHVETV
ncbi:MAG TPA: DNA polymerase III subunit alpha [Rhizomicrobium sp.]|jgi:DNA polymerase-3 subunit alpha|nr:DNA polymerase III subunit alpha [Rhizomicrobium sp.]